MSFFRGLMKFFRFLIDLIVSNRRFIWEMVLSLIGLFLFALLLLLIGAIGQEVYHISDMLISLHP